MKNNQPLVSILVLNYNGIRFLDDCFNSLAKTSYQNIEVWLIDNLSTEDDVAYTRKHFPDVKIYVNEGNFGYSLAYNNAFKIANGKYYVLLNNDTKVPSNWLTPMVEAAENDQNIGALQPKILCLQEPNRFEYAGASGGFMDKYGYPFTRGRVFFTMEEDSGQYDDICTIFWTSGAAMFVRASAIDKCGDLDVDFVHHMEEIDLCYRLNLAGYSLKVIPESVILHYGGATISYNSYKKIFWNHRNSLFMMLKNLEKKNITKFLFIRILLDILTICWALTKFNFNQIKAVINAYVWIIKNKNIIKEKRNQVKKVRVLNDKELFSSLFPKSIALEYFFKKKKTFKKLNYSTKP